MTSRVQIRLKISFKIVNIVILSFGCTFKLCYCIIRSLLILIRLTLILSIDFDIGIVEQRWVRSIFT